MSDPQPSLVDGMTMDTFFDEVGDVNSFGHEFDDIFDTVECREVKNADEDDSDGESIRHLDISRHPDFYKSDKEYVRKVGKDIRVRLFFHPGKSSFFAYWKKRNNLEVCSADTHFLVHCSFIQDLWAIVQAVCDEIDRTPWNSAPKSHQHRNGMLTDRNDPKYWEEPVAFWTPDKSIAVRSYKNDGGTYMIRFLLRRRFKEKFPQWLGRTMSMNLSEARQFIFVLKDFERILDKADKTRIEMAEAAMIERDRLEKSEPPVSSITPPDTPE